MGPLLIYLAYFALFMAIISQGYALQDRKQIEHIPIPEHFLYGSGIDNDHMLIYGCDPDSEVLKMNCTIIIRSTDGTKNHCNFNLTKHEVDSSVKVKMSVQLTTNRSVFEWYEKSRDRKLYIKHFEIVDTNSCNVLKSKSYTHERKNSDVRYRLKYLNVYEDGFSVVFYDEPCPNNRTCYQRFDHDGNEIGEYGVLPIESKSVLIQPVSLKTPAKGFYAYDFHWFTFRGLSIVGDGQVRRVINTTLKHAHVGFIDEQSTEICGFLEDNADDDDDDVDDLQTMQCYQYDLAKNKIFDVKLPDEDFSTLLAVRGFRSGGFLIFKNEYSSLDVIEMRPNQPMIEHRYAMTRGKKHPKVMNFDEQRGSFTFVYTQRNEDGTRTLLIYDLMIPSKFQPLEGQGDDTTTETNFNRVDEA